MVYSNPPTKVLLKCLESLMIYTHYKLDGFRMWMRSMAFFFF